MDSSRTTNEIAFDFGSLFCIYKDGRCERYVDVDFIPPSDNPDAAVRSKDVVISPETNVSARLYLPKTVDLDHKLPVLVYIHGGAFCTMSAFSSLYHNYLNSLVTQANVVAVSIEYRLAPENPIPACYDDSWMVMQWVASHANGGQGPEPWINDHADFRRVFLAGESAGANIAHNMVVRAGVNGLAFGVKIFGLVLVQPFFGNYKLDELWKLICPETSGVNDPRLNPAVHRGLLSKLVCNKVLVCTAEQDTLRGRGWTYYEALRNSDWAGVLEIMETEGEGHVFHLINPTLEKSGILMKRVASFLNHVPSLL